jgi:plastocyanin
MGNQGLQSYSPNSATAKPGQKVIWRNQDPAGPHGAKGNGFDTGSLQPGAESSPQTIAPGTYLYSCPDHPGMTGKLKVEAGAAPTASLRE